MCFNAPVSFATFAIVSATAVWLLIRDRQNDIWNGSFILSFVIIQFLEGLLWISIGQENTALNSTVTKLILLCLALQPLVQTLGGIYTNVVQYPKETFKSLKVGLLWGLFGILAVLLILSFGQVLKPSVHFSSSKGPGGHLKWEQCLGSGSRNEDGLGGIGCFSLRFFSNGQTWTAVLYVLGLLLPLLFMQPLYEGLTLVAVGLVTMILSYVFFTNEFASIWCFSAIAYALVALVFSLTKKVES